MGCSWERLQLLERINSMPICYFQRSTNKSANCLMYKVVMPPFQAKHSLLCAYSLNKSRQAWDVFQVQALQRIATSFVSICFTFEVMEWVAFLLLLRITGLFIVSLDHTPLCCSTQNSMVQRCVWMHVLSVMMLGSSEDHVHQMQR